MKRFVFLLLSFCLLLPFLIGCEAEKPVDTKHLPAKTEDISWEDRTTEDAITVSSVLSYSREEVELPNGISLIGLKKYAYAAEDGFYIPMKQRSSGQYAYRTTIYHYHTDGKPAEKIEVPCETECTELFRVLSDGRILLLQTNSYLDFSKVSLLLIDNTGEVICTSSEFSFNDSVQAFIDENAHGMHITEHEDGTMRILVNAINRVYYFDETLSLLSEVDLPTECKGITPLADDVYMIGSEMPAVCRVDLKNGTAKQTDVPVMPEMKYYSTFFSGGDGKLYCSYKDAIYLCQKNANGEESMQRLLNWYQGACDGQGFYWIVDESCMFYVPIFSMGYRTTLYVLHIGTNPDIQNRRVITLVMVINDEWLREAISMFNQMSEDYYILCVDLTNIVDGDAPIDRFDAYLLEGYKPDLVFLHNFYRRYAKKNLLIDLSADYGNRLLGAVRHTYTEGSGAMYVLPLNMTACTYACNASLLDGPLTWEQMYAWGEELKTSAPDDHMALTTVHVEVENVHHLMRRFVDYETKSSSFHCDEFHQIVRFKEDMAKRYVIEDYGTFGNNGFETGNRYAVIGNTEIISALKDGRVKLSYFPFLSLEGYASLKLFFGDTPFSLCGYPSEDDSRYTIDISAVGRLAVFSDSMNLGGCKTFLDFLLSDDMQTSDMLIQKALPVTRTALEKAIDENRYFYYNKKPSEIGNVMHAGRVWLLDAQASGAALDPRNASQYTVIEIKDEDKTRILSFFDHCVSYSNPDETINQILNEELSVYHAGIRTLEETTKIIDARVRIYLNE